MCLGMGWDGDGSWDGDGGCCGDGDDVIKGFGEGNGDRDGDGVNGVRAVN